MLLFTEGPYRRAIVLPEAGLLLPGRAGSPFAAHYPEDLPQDCCQFYYEQDSWWIRDQSRNGTFVNDARLQGAAKLTDQVSIRCGEARVRFQLLTAIPVGMPAGPAPGIAAEKTSTPDPELPTRELENLRRAYGEQQALLQRAHVELLALRRQADQWEAERRLIEELRQSWSDVKGQLGREKSQAAETLASLNEQLAAATKNGKIYLENRKELEALNAKLSRQLDELKVAHDGELRVSRDLRAALEAQRHIADHLAVEKAELYNALSEQQHLVRHLQIERQKIESQRDRLLRRESQQTALQAQTSRELDELQGRYERLLNDPKLLGSPNLGGERTPRTGVQFRVHRQLATLITMSRHLEEQDPPLSSFGAALRDQLKELVELLKEAYVEASLVARIGRAYEKGRQFKLLCAAISTTIDSLVGHHRDRQLLPDAKDSLILDASLSNARKLAENQSVLAADLLNDLLLDKIRA